MLVKLSAPLDCTPRTIATLNSALLANILDYLNDEQVQVLQLSLSPAQSCGVLRNMCDLRLVFSAYFNKADLSYFFNVFEVKKYKEVQTGHIYSLANNQKFAEFPAFPNKFKALLHNVQTMLPQHIGAPLAAQLHTILIDPEIPMPKLQRQSTAGFLNSSLQSFFSTLHDADYCTASFFEDETAENLCSFIEENEQSYFIKLMNSDLSVMKMLVANSHEITYANMHEFLIEGNTLHNLIVNILAMMELYVSHVCLYLESLADPFELMLQFISRYNQFQNTVIGFEDNYSFIFRNYDEICRDICNENRTEKFEFFRSAIQMWKAKMSDLEKKATQEYLNLMSKKLASNYGEFVQNCRSSTLAQALNLLQNESISRGSSSEVYQILSVYANEDIEVLLSNYSEYLVDMSIDEQVIRWISHSKFRFEETYLGVEQMVLKRQKQFTERLEQAQAEDTEGQVSGIMKQRLEEISQYLRPCTTSKLIEMYSVVGDFCLPELQEVDELILLYNKVNELPDEMYKAQEDCTTMDSEHSQKSDSQIGLYYESQDEGGMDEEIVGVYAQ